MKIFRDTITNLKFGVKKKNEKLVYLFSHSKSKVINFLVNKYATIRTPEHHTPHRIYPHE